MPRSRNPSPAERGGGTGLEAALDLLGDRWSLAVVAALLPGPARYQDLVVALAPIATNVLASRLRSLEGDGVVVAEPYATRPLRLRYALTARGRGLEPVLHALSAWAHDELGAEEPLARHRACGTGLTTRPWCPTCAVPVHDDDADEGLIRL